MQRRTAESRAPTSAVSPRSPSRSSSMGWAMITPGSAWMIAQWRRTSSGLTPMTWWRSIFLSVNNSSCYTALYVIYTCTWTSKLEHFVCKVCLCTTDDIYTPFSRHFYPKQQSFIHFKDGCSQELNPLYWRSKGHNLPTELQRSKHRIPCINSWVLLYNRFKAKINTMWHTVSVWHCLGVWELEGEPAW